MKKKAAKKSKFMTREEFHREINVILRGIHKSLQPLINAYKRSAESYKADASLDKTK